MSYPYIPENLLGGLKLDNKHGKNTVSEVRAVASPSFRMRTAVGSWVERVDGMMAVFLPGHSFYKSQDLLKAKFSTIRVS